jgi:hypothetical protein
VPTVCGEVLRSTLRIYAHELRLKEKFSARDGDSVLESGRIAYDYIFEVDG